MSPALDCAVAHATDAYLRAHAALVAAGTSPERPAAARRLADTWTHLNRTITAWRKSRAAIP